MNNLTKASMLSQRRLLPSPSASTPRCLRHELPRRITFSTCVKDSGLGQGLVLGTVYEKRRGSERHDASGFKEKPAGGRQASKERMSSHSSETRATEN